MMRISSRNRWGRALLGVWGMLAADAARAELLLELDPRPSAISGDGEVLVGNDDDPFRWRWRHGSPTFFSLPKPDTVYATSFDGSVIAAFENRWENGGVTDLGSSRRPNDVSADGGVVVGSAPSFLEPNRAFRWQAGVETLLERPPGMEGPCSALGVSADGTVIAGSCRPEAGVSPLHAVRWQDGASEDLGPATHVGGISADATTVVGAVPVEGGADEACFWRDGELTKLGRLREGDASRAVAASKDGSVIVGVSQAPDGYFDGIRDEVFLWDAAHGMRSLRSFLESRGVSVEYFSFAEVHGLSDDGFIVVGSGFPWDYQGGWLAYIAPDADNDRVLDDADAFPADPGESSDRDGDGVGDNGDVFPDDPSEHSDRDLDGVGDAGDPHPDDPTRPQRAAPAPGSVVVAAGANGLFQVDPASGAFSWLAFAPGFSPDDVAVGPSGSIYTLDRESQTLHRVFASTGEIRVVATDLSGSLGLDADERPVVAGPAGVVRVDPASGRSVRLAIEGFSRFGTSPFGDAFGVVADDGRLVSVDLRKAPVARSKPAVSPPGSRSVTLTLSYYGQDESLDVAAAGPRHVVVLRSPYASAALSVGDTVLGKWVDRAARPPATAEFFEPRSVALAGSDEIYLAGVLSESAGNREALLAFDGSFAPGRVVLRAPESFGSHGWGIALAPRLPAEPEAVACHGALSAHLPRHLRARARAAARCLEGHARGDGSAESCLEAWPVASAAVHRTRAAEARRCEPGAAGAAAIGAAARAAADGLLAELFGDIDTSLVLEAAQPDAAACQLGVASASVRCLHAQLAALGRCKKAQPGPFGASELERCSGALARDAAVRRACDPAAGRLARAATTASCQDEDPAALFPGCAAPSAAGLAACAAERAACLACRAMESLHRLDGACAACP